MNYYLLVYDRPRGAILEKREYLPAERTRAFEDRLALMIERRGQPDVEVVLLGADSYEDLAKTHSRYFKTSDEILADIESVKR